MPNKPDEEHVPGSWEDGNTFRTTAHQQYGIMENGSFLGFHQTKSEARGCVAKALTWFH